MPMDLDTVRRRAAAIVRNGIYMVEPGLYPNCMPLNSFWWTDQRNFGDQLTRLLLPKYGIAPILKPPSAAEFFGTGSLIEMIPVGFRGWVWGTGKMREESQISLSSARVLAVRGALTRESLALSPSVTLGDPGLLVSRLVDRRGQTDRVAIVPHFTHQTLPDIHALLSRLGPGAFLVDVAKHPRHVVSEIASARAVITTSLHGLVTADAYGIPAAWALPDPVLTGGAFKFRDHESVVLPQGRSRRIELRDLANLQDVFAVSSPANTAVVRSVQLKLIAALDRLRAEEPRRISPLLLAREQLRRTPTTVGAESDP